MPITLLTSAPPALTRSDLATLSESTPATFVDIPPLLRHEQRDLSWTIEPSFEGLKGGNATLFVTEGALSIYNEELKQGLSIPYPHLTLHAISRVPLKPTLSSSSTLNDESLTNPTSSSTPTTTTNNGTSSTTAREGEVGGPCIYCQIDSEIFESDQDEPLNSITYELILIPTESESLDTIFLALSSCASLHPSSSGGEEPSSSLFGGLDPSSMMYADAEGNLVGPGIETMTQQEEDQLDSRVGRAAMKYLRGEDESEDEEQEKSVGNEGLKEAGKNNEPQ